MTEDEMVGWHHQLNGHEFGWTPGVGDQEYVCERDPVFYASSEMDPEMP